MVASPQQQACRAQAQRCQSTANKPMNLLLHHRKSVRLQHSYRSVSSMDTSRLFCRSPVKAKSPSPTTTALAHCPGRVDIVSRTTPACEARGGKRDEKDKLFIPVEKNEGSGRAERRERKNRCRGSINGQRV
jgi:hypothetical protein